MRVKEMHDKQIRDKNYHCSVVIINNAGILIEGPSGAGKTSLALGLIEAYNKTHISAALVSDDQAFLRIEEDCLIASVPQSIAGKVEIRGFGITSIENVESAKISLIVSLEDYKKMERMPQLETKTLLGISIPFLKVPMRHEAQAVRIVKAWLAENAAHVQ